MSSVHFRDLMALSATHTKQQESAVQQALAERQRKERERLKQQEEQDRKERERERQQRLKHFENQKKEQERLARREQDEERMEALRRRREAEHMDKLLGKRKTDGGGKEPKWPTSASQERAKEEVRKKRLPTADAGTDDSGSMSFLTREEKRKQKQDMEMKRLYCSTKRSSNSGSTSYTKSGRRLPGGAVDITTTPGAQQDDTQTGNVRQRLAKQPMVLTKLNAVKRDTRTIDEILRDRAKAKEKVLDGEEAKGFDDWFGDKKKEKDKEKEAARKAAALASANASPVPQSLPVSGTNTPTSRSTPTAASASSSHAANGAKKAPIPKTNGTNMFIKTNGAAQKYPLPGKALPYGNGSSAAQRTIPASSTSRAGSSTGTTRPAMSGSGSASMKSGGAGVANGKYTTSSSARAGGSGLSSAALLGSSSGKKRPRSESRSESPPLKKRAHDRDGRGNKYRDSYREEDDLDGNIQTEIWKMFGRDRAQYVERDIFSDEEDMEADASDLEKEELMSARIARREDALAEAEEKRREEEKRRRKKEKEAAARRGY
ncbi:hypothetical protein BDN72DRAFT_853510 [Pluteus cervinus]|uniref:Uncharacterized protein n=1 Tax=Pluteus cervinus TaxID=181527 RepID=A0ACD3BAA1_9AGAR|nr:hypothetical protein BDN72DRAFT_853510 [Pluteus cervinus]